MKSIFLVSPDNTDEKNSSLIFESLKIVSSMIAVFMVLAITGPLAYGLQQLEFLF